MAKDINNGFDAAQKVVDKLKEPENYQVILLNDDYTSMDFVVDVLMAVFHKSMEDAANIMMSVHKKGSGLAGVYTWDIAVTKADQVHNLARQNEYPLRCKVEKA